MRNTYDAQYNYAVQGLIVFPVDYYCSFMGRTEPLALAQHIHEDGRYPVPRADDQDTMRNLKVGYWPEDMQRRYDQTCKDWIATLPEVERPLKAEDIMRTPPPPPAEPQVGPEPVFPGPLPGSPNEPTLRTSSTMNKISSSMYSRDVSKSASNSQDCTGKLYKSPAAPSSSCAAAAVKDEDEVKDVVKEKAKTEVVNRTLKPQGGSRKGIHLRAPCR